MSDNSRIILSVLHKNICYGYSLESPQRGNSNEYPQHMFLWRNTQNYPLIIIQDFRESTMLVNSFRKNPKTSGT